MFPTKTYHTNNRLAKVIIKLSQVTARFTLAILPVEWTGLMPFHLSKYTTLHPSQVLFSNVKVDVSQLDIS